MPSRSLEMPRRSEPAQASRLWRTLAIIAVFFVAVGWAVWYLRTPDGLPTSPRTVDDRGVVGHAVYVGMFAVGPDFDRTLHISKVDVDVTPDAGVKVEPMLCRGGSVGVTTDPSGSCEDLVDAEGAELSDDDSIVLAVTASEPTTVKIGRLEISFRDGFKWGRKSAGLAGATLAFAESTPGTVPDDGADDDPAGRPDRDQSGKKDEKKNRQKGSDDAPTDSGA